MNIFTNYKIKNFNIKNRIVLPPMVRPKIIGKDGFVNDELVEWYETVAKNDVGMIIVEAACVNPNFKLRENQLGIWGEEFIEGLTKIVNAVHKYDCVVLLQIHHYGFREKIIEPSSEELDNILSEFIDAFKRAKKSGFDGVEIHGAHRYLLSQLKSKIWNQRDDKYGGSFENRMRFSRELIKKTKYMFDDNFLLSYRMGGNEPSLEDGKNIAKELEKYGVDILHVSHGVPDPEIKREVKIDLPSDFPLKWVVYLGVEIKKLVKIPVICVYMIKEEEEASWLVENELCDFVAVGRAMLINPNWVKTARRKYNIRIRGNNKN